MKYFDKKYSQFCEQSIQNDYLNNDLKGEYCGEHIVKVCQHL